MRIIAGIAKGRRLLAPRGEGTRPMMDRAREGLFSSLGETVAGARVLDLYAGTGSLGLEALSRGASDAVFVERGPAAVAALRANVAAVGLVGEVVAADVDAYLERAAGPFDLVFVDPPYALPLASVERALGRLMRLLSAGGTVVLHRRVGEGLGRLPGLTVIDRRRYGDTEITRLVKEEAL
ncbi:MAG TPA: 16S rRNA (guanine(966)-N(2))-methyltransferase RsmD [Acidimicrobiia bacterium]|nr:16S rRNA (guanine(966)-N(2))-methyltransferase RsmD [Acidimicrobiia bacterium]